ncbi:MAG TPA: P-loop NTPase fold protein, partial [Candidatus Elarobacter sp.]|nr:P-loop NTPase fold protein [Candidatus Elarobacter sp.]
SAFVIGADEDLVRHAVRERFPEVRGSAVDVSTSYLEKLIQVPLRVPPLGRAEMETYMNLLFTELHLGTERTRELLGNLPRKAPDALGTVGFTYDTVRTAVGADDSALSDDLAMVSQTADILTAGLKGNPRQTKRFLNAMLLRMRMAEARDVVLKRRVLAKLMLLEYLHTRAFVQVGDWQASNQGIAAPLADMERQARRLDAEHGDAPPSAVTVESESLVGQHASRPVSGAGTRAGDGEGPPLPDDAAQWVEHPWLRRWLQLDPPLGAVDLRPYYFFARDRVTVSERAVSRMTAEARRLLADLQSDSDVRRTGAIGQVAGLSPSDATAIVEVLNDQVRRAEDLRGNRSPLAVLLDVVGKRPELVADAVAFLAALEEGRVGGGVPPVLVALVRNTPSDQAGRELLTRWTKSSNEGLRASAQAALAPRPQRQHRPQAGR